MATSFIIYVGFVLHTLWFESTISSSFFVGPERVNWFDARDFCTSQGGVLATIRNDAEQQEALSVCPIIADDIGCWIGLNDHNTPDQYEWEDQSPLCYGFDDNGAPQPGIGPFPIWRPNQPNQDNENCIELITFGGTTGWGDWICNETEFGDLPLCRKTCNSGDGCSCFLDTKFDRKPLEIINNVQTEKCCCNRCINDKYCNSWDFYNNICRLFNEKVDCDLIASNGWISGGIMDNGIYNYAANDFNVHNVDVALDNKDSYDLLNFIMLIAILVTNIFVIAFYMYSKNMLCCSTTDTAISIKY